MSQFVGETEQQKVVFLTKTQLIYEDVSPQIADKDNINRWNMSNEHETFKEI